MTGDRFRRCEMTPRLLFEFPSPTPCCVTYCMFCIIIDVWCHFSILVAHLRRTLTGKVILFLYHQFILSALQEFCFSPLCFTKSTCSLYNESITDECDTPARMFAKSTGLFSFSHMAVWDKTCRKYTGNPNRRSGKTIGWTFKSVTLNFFFCCKMVTGQGIYWCLDQHLILIIAQWSNCNAGILFELKLWPKPVASREKSSLLSDIQIFLQFFFSTCWILGADLSVLVCLRYQNKILLFLLMLHFKCDTVWTIHRSSISWTKDICLKMDVGPNFSKF